MNRTQRFPPLSRFSIYFDWITDWWWWSSLSSLSSPSSPDDDQCHDDDDDVQGGSQPSLAPLPQTLSQLLKHHSQVPPLSTHLSTHLSIHLSTHYQHNTTLRFPHCHHDSDHCRNNGDDDGRDIIYQNCHHHQGNDYDDGHHHPFNNHPFDSTRAGVSNMKGYKKSNQDRCTAFSYLEVTSWQFFLIRSNPETRNYGLYVEAKYGLFPPMLNWFERKRLRSQLWLQELLIFECWLHWASHHGLPAS